MAGDTQGVSRDTLFPWGAPPPEMESGASWVWMPSLQGATGPEHS